MLYFGKNRHRWRRRGFTGYGRLGFGWLNNSDKGNVTYEQEESSHVHYGLGFEYATRQGLGVRAEYIMIAKDVSYAQLGLIYRTGRRDDRPVLDKPEGLIPTITSATIVEEVIDNDRDGVEDEVDKCPSTNVGISVDVQGCAKFDAVLKGVNFNDNSDQLTAESKRLLQGVGETLNASLEVHVQISAHTDNRGSTVFNQQLSINRARSVSLLLMQGGVDKSRMTELSYGETQPIASNKTADGRRRNRRVEVSAVAR